MFGVNPCIRIEVPITNKKDRETYFGPLNYQSKEFHVQSHLSGDVKSTVKFIKYLQNKYKDRKIILIWMELVIINMGNLETFY